MSELLRQIAAIIESETAYAAKRQQQGDFAQAKLIFAAIGDITRTVRSVDDRQDDSDYLIRLEAALHQARQRYVYDWNDQDGIGTSSFSRVLRLFDVT